MQKQKQLTVEQLESRVLLTASPTSSFATIAARYALDGTGNNVANPSWGSAGATLLRTAPADYADGLSIPAGEDRPSARVLSNALSDQTGIDIPSDRQLSAMIYAWGQFIDHDIDLTPIGAKESFFVSVPTGDPSFDPMGTGIEVIPLSRSIYDPTTGVTSPREQVNVITAFLDGSMVYGSDQSTATALRTLSGGRLKTSAGDLLPKNDLATFPDGALPMANDARIYPNDHMFAAGDVRANENVELTSIHTLFVREHNYWADKIGADNPRLSDQQIYQQARAIVIAEIQSITFNQWLPAVLGRNAVDDYSGYDKTVNPGIANEFSGAAFRFGHSLLGDDIEFLDDRGVAIADEIPLSQAFFNPHMLDDHSIDSIIKYLASDPSSELDTRLVDGVRNFLFGLPGAGGMDLASLNIQRGREHGLADYNTVRASYGLPRVTSFDQITSDPETQQKLQALYGTVDNIDLWVGSLAEDHVRGASVGPTLQAVISDQFERLRDGDRFWFERTFSGRMLAQLENTTLADIVRRNTDLTNVQDNLFFFRATISGTVFNDSNGNGHEDRNERGMSGQTVQLVNANGGEIVATTLTNARGQYSFDVLDGIRTGQYRVQLIIADGVGRVTTPLRTVSITRGGQSLEVNLGWKRSTTVRPSISTTNLATALKSMAEKMSAMLDGDPTDCPLASQLLARLNPKAVDSIFGAS